MQVGNAIVYLVNSKKEKLQLPQNQDVVAGRGAEVLSVNHPRCSRKQAKLECVSNDEPFLGLKITALGTNALGKRENRLSFRHYSCKELIK